MCVVAKRPVVIEGEKVALGPIVEEDLDKFWFWVNDKTVTQYLSDKLFLGVYTRSMEEKWIRSVLEGDKNTLTFAILLKPEYEVIGVISLGKVDWISRNAELGVFIGNKDLWGQGLGSEAIVLLLDYAFNVLSLIKVYLRVIEYNRRAIRAYVKVGFREVGRLRKHIFRGGRFWDVIIMEIHSDEFDQKKSKIREKCSDLFT